MTLWIHLVKLKLQPTINPVTRPRWPRYAEQLQHLQGIHRTRLSTHTCAMGWTHLGSGAASYIRSPVFFSGWYHHVLDYKYIYIIQLYTYKYIDIYVCDIVLAIQFFILSWENPPTLPFSSKYIHRRSPQTGFFPSLPQCWRRWGPYQSRP